MPSGNGVTVNTGGLADFAGKVDSVTAGGLRPEVVNSMTAYRRGTQFGAGLSAASGSLQDAREKYQRCLQQGSETLAEFVRASELLVGVIRQVQQNYGNADLAAAQNNAVVADAMNAISAQFDQRRQASTEAYASAQDANDHGAGASTLRGDYQL